MKVTKTSQYRGTIEDLWHIISNAMRAEGMERSAAAVKNQWNRSLRWKSKFDERARKKPGASKLMCAVLDLRVLTPLPVRTGINNYPEPKFRLAERRKRQQESSGDTESVPNRHGSVETTGSNETDNDEKMEREHESDDTADTQERQPLAMNANRARVPAGGDSTAAENGFTHSASIRARGCHDEDLDASETDEDMDDGN